MLRERDPEEAVLFSEVRNDIVLMLWERDPEVCLCREAVLFSRDRNA